MKYNKITSRAVSGLLFVILLFVMSASCIGVSARGWFTPETGTTTNSWIGPSTTAGSDITDPPTPPVSESEPQSEQPSEPHSEAQNPPEHSDPVSETQGNEPESEPEQDDEPDVQHRPTQAQGGTTPAAPRNTTAAPARVTVPQQVVNPDATIKVTFNSNGGTPIEPVMLTDRSLVPEPTPPTREGFEFVAWFKDPEFSALLDFSTDRVKSNVTVYAGWRQITDDTLYSITFRGEAVGGTLQANPATAIQGEMVVITILPDEGKKLINGSIKLNGLPYDMLYFEMPANDVVITAEFEDIPIIEEGESIISKTAMIALGVAALAVITLASIAFTMREKETGNLEADWSDDSIVLTDVSVKDGKIEADSLPESANSDIAFFDEVASIEKASIERIPIEEAPIEKNPIEKAPIEKNPIEKAPIEEALIAEVPIEKIPIAEVPIEKITIKEIPIEKISAEDLPEEETPTE